MNPTLDTMITDNMKRLAQQAMEYALKNGCQAARVAYYSGTNSSFDLRDGRFDRLQQATENSLVVHLFVDGRFGSFSTNRIERDEVEQLIRSGIASVRYLAEDRFRRLPDPVRYYRGDGPDLNLLDPKFESLQPGEKIALAQAAAEEIAGTDPRILSAVTSYSDGVDYKYLIDSNGLEVTGGSTWYNLSAQVSIRGEGEARPSAYWYDTSLFYDELKKTGIGRKALERALGKIGQRKIASGRYPMLVDPQNSAQLVSPLIQALYGSALQQKNSFLLDKLHQQVGSAKLNLADRPHLPRSAGARYFDNEGVATQTRPVFENGILQTYFIDTYYAAKMETAPTVGAPSILVMEPGTSDTDALVASLDRGILVTGFNGGNSNSTTGDFSYGIEGFLIENGKRTQPVSEMNITGNLTELWSSLAETGDDAVRSSSWRIPSLLFDGVDFSGI